MKTHATGVETNIRELIRTLDPSIMSAYSCARALIGKLARQHPDIADALRELFDKAAAQGDEQVRKHRMTPAALVRLEQLDAERGGLRW